MKLYRLEHKNGLGFFKGFRNGSFPERLYDLKRELNNNHLTPCLESNYHEFKEDLYQKFFFTEKAYNNKELGKIIKKIKRFKKYINFITLDLPENNQNILFKGTSGMQVTICGKFLDSRNGTNMEYKQ